MSSLLALSREWTTFAYLDVDVGYTYLKRNINTKAEEGILLFCHENPQYKVWIPTRSTAILARHVVIDEKLFPGRELSTQPPLTKQTTANRPVETSDTGQRAYFPSELQRDRSSASTTNGIGTGADEKSHSDSDSDESIEIDLDALTYIPHHREENDDDKDDKDSEDGDNENEQEGGEGDLSDKRVSDGSTETSRRYPSRNHRSPQYYTPGQVNVANAIDEKEPDGIEEALSGGESTEWKAAVISELKSLQKHGTWRIVSRSEDIKAIPTKFVFNRKLNEDGSVSRYKARLVVKGYFQGTVEDTYSPVVDFNAVRTALAVAVQRGMHLHQIDIRTAFLHGEIDSNIHVLPPQGLEKMGIRLCSNHEALKLQKGLYGLKQSPKLWNQKWETVMNDLKFVSISSDPCIYYCRGVWILLYVDDVILMSHCQERVMEIIDQISCRLDVKDLGPLHNFLGITFRRGLSGAVLSQEHYVESILSRFGMSQCKPVKTPACTDNILQADSHAFDPTSFREIVGALLFLSTRTRPDISIAVGMSARNVSKPNLQHMRAAKRVLRYLRGTSNFVLHLSPKPGDLVAYADADWGGDKGDRKSTSGYILQLGNTSVLWKTSKQKLVALSTGEAEFVSASDACRDIIWLRCLLQKLGVDSSKPTVLHEDNQTAIHWGKEGVRNAKHVAIRRNFLLDNVRRNIIELTYCPSEEMIADTLTKPLLRFAFERHRDALGVIEYHRHLLEE